MKNGPMGIPADISMDCLVRRTAEVTVQAGLWRGSWFAWEETYLENYGNIETCTWKWRFTSLAPPWILLHAWNLWGWFQRYAESSDCHCFTPKWASVGDLRGCSTSKISHHQSHFYCFPSLIQIFFLLLSHQIGAKMRGLKSLTMKDILVFWGGFQFHRRIFLAPACQLASLSLATTTSETTADTKQYNTSEVRGARR